MARATSAMIEANKSKVLAALTAAETFTAAAEAAGISRKTLFNYLRDDTNFALAYRAQCDYMAIERAETAHADKLAAMMTLRSVMGDDEQPAAVRVKAAQVLIEQADAALKSGVVAAQHVLDGHSVFNKDFYE